MTTAAETLVAGRLRLVRLMTQCALQRARIVRAERARKNLERGDEENRCDSCTRDDAGMTHAHGYLGTFERLRQAIPFIRTAACLMREARLDATLVFS